MRTRIAGRARWRVRLRRGAQVRAPGLAERLSVRGPYALDPVTDIRDAIGAGTAQDEGATQLDGRTVERIRIELPSGEPAYAYVDPHTFYPVEEECDCGSAGPITGLHVVIRYLTFEYLPRTGASLALTDIEAQHPNATTTG